MDRTVPAENSYQLTTTGQIVVTEIANLYRVYKRLPNSKWSKRRCLSRCRLNRPSWTAVKSSSATSTIRMPRQTAFLDLVRETERLHAALPTLNPHHLDAFVANVTVGTHIECISVSSAFELLRTECPTAFTTVQEAPMARLFICEESRLFGIYRCDNTVGLLGYDEFMTIETFVTAPASYKFVVAWVTNQYETRKQAATVYA